MENKPLLYLFSGLGADKKAFQLMDFTDYRVQYIEWLIPEPKEPISDYAQRIGRQIDEGNFMFIGLSFGGVVAQELAKFYPPQKIILISSVKSTLEIPWYFRFLGAWNLLRFIPIRFLKNGGTVANWFFGTTSLEERQLLQNILRDTNPIFLKWALHQLANWKYLASKNRPIHFHGSRDRLLPIALIKDAVIVDGGGHLMVFAKPLELSRMISTECER